jgi:hypothetical protein
MNYLVNLIIRPSKSLYEESDLGDSVFNYYGHEFKRIDFDKKVIII